jgi:hypothetical protein
VNDLTLLGDSPFDAIRREDENGEYRDRPDRPPWRIGSVLREPATDDRWLLDELGNLRCLTRDLDVFAVDALDTRDWELVGDRPEMRAKVRESVIARLMERRAEIDARIALLRGMS